jgi:DNA modification methylase
VLYKTKSGGRTLYRTRPLLLTPQQAYTPPAPGKAWFATTTTVWRADELIRRSVRDWRRLTGEDGHTGTRAETMRQDHDSVYTGTTSIFPAPLVEWVLLRYGGKRGGRILDAFAGGPPRGLVSTIMGYRYLGIEIRQEQIDEDKKVLAELNLEGAEYLLADGRYFEVEKNSFDCGLTCPPYWNLEEYSDLPNDLSNLKTYWQFNAGMFFSAVANFKALKPGAFMCIIVGPFRDKKTGELIDFRSHTVENFKEAGFLFWQEIILSKNFASAAKRSTNAWHNFKLVPCHEYLLVFRKPGNEDARSVQQKRQSPFLVEGTD